MILLSKDDIEKGLTSLYAWEYDNKSIRKTYLFNAYIDGIKFVNEIAEIAEKNNHHPDLYVGWRKVTVTFTSHALGGVTTKCVDLAISVENLFRNMNNN